MVAPRAVEINGRYSVCEKMNEFLAYWDELTHCRDANQPGKDKVRYAEDV
jgi:hypothetical protein